MSEMDGGGSINAALKTLSTETGDFWVSPQIRRVKGPISSLEFMRAVSRSEPMIITGVVSQWPAFAKWTDEYLQQKMGSKELTVDITPHGVGDAVLQVQTNPTETVASANNVVPAATATKTLPLSSTQKVEEMFVKPLEQRMNMRKFFQYLRSAKRATVGYRECNLDPTPPQCGTGIPYLSHQNDNLRDELPSLAEDVPPVVDFVKGALQNDPDAVNLWIGDGRAVSSMHKDHYENVMCVVRGTKSFVLLPPSDAPFLYENTFPSARFRFAGGRFAVTRDRPHTRTSWIPVCPLAPDLRRYPLFRLAHPIRCDVKAGEMLYLPALWYHRVTQRGLTVAVNYWHDMHFGHHYIYHNLLQNIASGLGRPKDEVEEEELEDVSDRDD